MGTKGNSKGKGSKMQQMMAMMMGGGWGQGRKGGGKGNGKNRANMGIVSGNAKTNPEKVAWIGGLQEKESGTFEEYKEINKKLKAHIVKLAGEGCKFVNITKDKVEQSSRQRRKHKQLSKQSTAKSPW